MRPVYDDFDEFDFEFADSMIVRQMLREKQREQRRLASLRANGPGSKRSREEFKAPWDDEDYEDYEDYDEYDEYDDDEFDSYTGHGLD